MRAHRVAEGRRSTLIGSGAVVVAEPCEPVGLPEPPPHLAPYACTVSEDGTDGTLTLAGGRGSGENLRRTGGAGVASVTGLDTFTIVGGAGTAYEVRVRRSGLDTPHTTVGHT